MDNRLPYDATKIVNSSENGMDFKKIALPVSFAGDE